MTIQHRLTPLVLALTGTVLTAPLRAQLIVPSDGSDGALNVTSDTVIDLSQAVTGTWNQDNIANAGKGVYDPEKWVIVFKYSAVTVAGQTTGTPAVLTGRKVTFINHPSHAPVMWLVQGNVTINGIVSLDGEAGVENASISHIPKEPGPGGFRGGVSSATSRGAGLGPAGGNLSNQPFSGYSLQYGNPQILPLIGGSGEGVGSNEGLGWASAAGGGAILIASQGTVTVNGLISAKGGGPRAAGGAIKMIANNILGTGGLTATRGSGSTGLPGVNPGEAGRIRLEANNLSLSLLTTPESIAVPPGNTPVLFPPSNAPVVKIVSVDSLLSPMDPLAPLRTSADIGIQNSGQSSILLQTTNFPIEGVVQCRIAPKFGNFSWMNATRLSGNFASAQWRVQTTLPTGFVTVQARATAP